MQAEGAGAGRAASPRTWKEPGSGWSVVTSTTPDGGEAAWRSSQPVPRRAGHRVPHPSPLVPPLPSPPQPQRPEPRRFPSRGAPARLGRSAALGSVRGRGRGAPPSWIRTVREPPPARPGAGSGLAEPRARARARARAAREGGRAEEGAWQRRKGVVGNRAAAASGLLSGGSAPLLPRLSRLRPSGKMPSAPGCEEGTGVAVRGAAAAAAAVARVL